MYLLSFMPNQNTLRLSVHAHFINSEHSIACMIPMHNYQMWLTCSSELRDLQFADWFSLVVAGIQAQQVCLPFYLAHLALALISRLSLTYLIVYGCCLFTFLPRCCLVREL